MRYSQIRSMDISNGENIGISLFTQGCPFHCYNCFNSETWDFNGGKEWNNDVKEKFLKLINQSHIKRVSILGGEPLYKNNLFDLNSLIHEINISFPEKTIWLYTGYTFDELKRKYNDYKYTPFAPIADEWLTRWEIISMCNVLVDGEYIDAERDVTLKWRGSKNQRVIDVQKSLAEDKMILYCN